MIKYGVDALTLFTDKMMQQPPPVLAVAMVLSMSRWLLTGALEEASNKYLLHQRTTRFFLCLKHFTNFLLGMLVLQCDCIPWECGFALVRCCKVDVYVDMYGVLLSILKGYYFYDLVWLFTTSISSFKLRNTVNAIGRGKEAWKHF